MVTAQITNHGTTQSVALPEGVRFEGEQVLVKRVGSSVILIHPCVDPWDVMAESLGQFTDDYMADRAQPTEQQDREAPFE